MTLQQIKTLIILYCIKVITLDYKVIRTEIKNETPKGKIKVLDLGCGTGLFAQNFDSQSYLGIDIDPESIAIAKMQRPKYRFLSGDISKYESSIKYDLVLVVGVLHHLTNRQMDNTLGFIKNSLKQNGQAIIIEAIPPILNFNIPGKILRKLDQGHHIRKTKNYLESMEQKFDIIHSKEILGGFVDYAFFKLSNKAR